MKPRLLDLFCGAGGAAMGYARAGFEVVGVDIKPQPNYPFEFYIGDALDYLRDALTPCRACDQDDPYEDCTCYASLAGFDAIHASPPCQAFTAYKRTGNVGSDHENLISPTRELLLQTGLPYVMENVYGAPLAAPVMICGTMFDPPMEVERHRYFETNWWIEPPQWPCRHKLNGPDRYPGGRSVARTGTSTGKVRRTVEVGSWDIALAKQKEAMGIDWMTLQDLSQAIPPAYTEFIGHQLIAHLSQQNYAALEARLDGTA